MTKDLNKISKGEINRLGDKIRKSDAPISDELLQGLQSYRTSHKEALSQVFNILCDASRKVKKESIVTYRIKRFESIIRKLDRHSSMQFSRMWDIGGCRCILKNDDQVYKLKNEIEKHLVIKKVNDYIIKPQKEGYRSLHLYVKLPDNDRIIEVQIRNQNDHNWATLVEITDLLLDTKLKEYGEHKPLLNFHLLLSRLSKLNTKEKKIVANTIKKYKYFEKLSDVFTRNYLQVRKRWLEIETQSDHKFFLITAAKDVVPVIESFSSFNEAEQRYFDVYKSSQNVNLVLTHLPTPNYHQISIAYSNYILTFHTFMDDCQRIIGNLIVESLKDRKVISFIKFFGLYNNIVLFHIKNLLFEMAEAAKYAKQNPEKYKRRRKKKKNKKEKEWDRDIKSQVESHKERVIKLRNSLKKNIPSSPITRFFVIKTIQIISKKYDNRLKRMIEQQNSKS